MVENETINCIVNGLIEYGLISKTQSIDVGQTLLNENVTSVNSRYNEDNEPDYPFKFSRKDYTQLEIFGCIRNWQYQTCEYEEHESEMGWILTEQLLFHLPSYLANEDYPWGLSDN